MNSENWCNFRKVLAPLWSAICDERIRGHPNELTRLTIQYSATIAISSTLRKEKIDEMILCEKKNQWCDFFTVKLQARQVVFSLRLRKVEVQFTKVPKQVCTTDYGHPMKT